MGAAAYYTELWLHNLWPAPWWVPRVVRVGAAIGVALAVLALAAAALRIEEFGQAMRRVLRRK
jgi:hypothetical protein